MILVTGATSHVGRAIVCRLASLGHDVVAMVECANSSETARVVGDARRRREKVLEKIERRLQGRTADT